jgi:hypothetical protein
MSRTSYSFLLHRVYERFTASAAALAITALAFVSVNAEAASFTAAKPSVTILVPTVTIEVVG